MRGLNSASFQRNWNSIYDGSNPGHKTDRWRVDGVEWIKERHYYWGERYSFQVETHRLTHDDSAKPGWTLLVVIERWWGPDKNRDLRQVQWAKILSGSSDKVLAWVRRQNVAA
jgi:hypothetical protein